MGPIVGMNFAAFDLNLLRVFDAVMRERSVTRAGDRIGLSQPAVSSALNRLRHLLNDQLFVRRGNDMAPTPRAEALAEPVREVMARLEAALGAEDRFDPRTAERTYTLLGADFFSTQVMPGLFRTMSGKAPGVRLRLLDSGHGDVGRLLLEDVIDAALEAPMELPDWVSRQPLFVSPFSIVAARSDPAMAGLTDGDTVPLELFCARPHALRSISGAMSGWIDDALLKIGHTRRVMLALPHFQGVVLAVAQGDLIAAVPAQLARAVARDLDLLVLQPPMDVPAPEIQMYWHSRHDRNPAHGWMREEVLAAVQSL
jgi:DNA-binding transcriptional LysR family regulator